MTQFFAKYAEKIIDNGFRGIVAVLPREKRPRFKKWQAASFKPTDLTWLVKHAKKYPNDSVGIACGSIVIAIDIDAADAATAQNLHQIATEEFGKTPLVRIGQPPKRLLVYRASDAIDKQHVGKIDILGQGSQFVAFGIHPGTGRPYYWIDGDPSNTDVASIPSISLADVKRFLGRACEVMGCAARIMPGAFVANDNHPSVAIPRSPVRTSTKEHGKFASRIVYNADGRIIDGREAYLALLVLQTFQDGFRTPKELAQKAWLDFCARADLGRPKGSSPKKRWSYRDALTKARSTCRNAINLRPNIKSSGRDPADHQHNHRLIDYWTAVRKKQHQAETARRIMTPSIHVVNQVMLDAVPIEAGQCVDTANQIKNRAGLGLSTVKAARRELIECALWIAERGVYVPVPVTEYAIGQAPELTERMARGVQTNADSLSTTGLSPRQVQGLPRTKGTNGITLQASNDNEEPKAKTSEAA